MPVPTPTGELISRPDSPALDMLVGRQFPIGNGFIRVVDYMGNDTVVRDAALAYANEDRLDARVLRKFMLHQHMAPLHAYHIKFHIVLPICLARQWLRLRTVAMRSMSERYHTLTNEFFVPDGAHWALSGLQEPSLEDIAILLNKLKAEALDVFQEYEGTGALGFTAQRPPEGLENQEGLTQLCWSVSVANLLHFLHPMWGPSESLDVPEYEEVLQHVVERWLPTVWKIYKEHGDTDLVLDERDRIVVQRLLAQHDNVHQFDLAFDDLGIKEGDKEEILVKLRSLGFNPETPLSH